MAAEIFPSYPPELSQTQLSYLLQTLTDYSLSHGLTVRPAESFVSEKLSPNGSLATHAPVTLFPSPFPRSCWDEGRAVQRGYNELYARVAGNEEWLEKIMVELSEVDDFMARLHKVHLDVKAEGFVQPLSLGLFRSDYMIHVSPEDPRATPVIHQVEFNTIASSFGALSTRVSELHRHLAKMGAYPSDSIINVESIPVSPALQESAKGLAVAHKAYGSGGKGRSTAVFMIIQPGEKNVFDQRWLEYELLEKHGVQTYRISLPDVPKLTKLASGTRALIYSPPHAPNMQIEISTVYFRAGYGPGDYAGEDDWAARTTLERSRAIKCPSVITQLAGAKKIQQVLAMDGAVEKFLVDQSISSRIRSTFAAIHPLDQSPPGMAARKLALEKPDTYVLKPQREGGGNNIYRGDIPGFLKSIPESHWSGYILMELIEPPALENTIIRNGGLMSGGVIGELGVYGAILWRDGEGEERGKGLKEILMNEEAGWLLRTKGRQSDEGGVAAGFGSVDAVLLVD
ncbi:glutathione synthase [Choiromyces venosus 120613-1]|uniref:Glutathione synthetase n=1 Tax=Choiromyces venosus 120613-1 TaxID=1336337 RepID=A0A3N4K4Z6_9PEZI|nr:glutathione synthase [Choiromyces venosus 120613-1]